ncbi:MAG: glucoamylase family protein [Cyclonatronaceae bacterium]
MLIPGLLLVLLIAGCKDGGNGGDPGVFQLLKVSADSVILTPGSIRTGVSVTPSFEISFSSPADTTSAKNSITLTDADNKQSIQLLFTFENDDSRILIETSQPLDQFNTYRLEISETMRSRSGAQFPGISYLIETERGLITLNSATLNGINLLTPAQIRNISYDSIELIFDFSEPLDPDNYQGFFSFTPSVPVTFSLENENQRVVVKNSMPLEYYEQYLAVINSNLISAQGFEFDGFSKAFLTGLNPETKLPLLTDEALLDKIQQHTFRYFWEFAHPVSGLARERNTSGELVTIGGSGFGLKAILTGIHRGFISRGEGVERLRKIVTFLGNADRFHGVWPHWMNGSNGRTIAFSTNDDGADLVETSFMAQGLITVRQFLDETDPLENNLIDDINALLDTIEWDWFTRGGQDVLYWHWSPNKGWAMNMQIKGYNEALITYLLAASSKNHRINPDVYHRGWASSGAILNGNSFYGIPLPVGYNYGGPLFFTHYSFLGLDPRNLSDTYADYWVQNRNHTRINRAHSIANPNNFVGYSDVSWGLTASDNPFGYLAHEPTRDNGTITPTAAISSIPYTPEESMEAIRHFYYVLGDKLWGEYGFYDAFNPTNAWWANSYLAIDQGPIIIMIENHRSGLLWDLFMTAPEIQTALEELGFTSGQ